MAKIRGGQVKSIRALKKSIKRSTSNGAIARVPKDAPLTVRFLEEPDRWFEFFTHYDQQAKKSFICVDGQCPGCDDDIRASKRLLTNAVNVDESKVVALELPISVVNILLKRYDKYGTVMDRDYELSRDGEGKETEYDCVAEGRSEFNFDAYELLDLGQILEDQIAADGSDTEDDEEEEEFLPPRKKVAPPKKMGGVRRPVRSRDEDDDEDEPPFKPNKTLSKTGSAAKKSLPVKRVLPAKKTAPATKGLRRR
jgi:hypothetical protein